MSDEVYDLAVIGAGPAGMTAAIYAVRSGLRTILLDAGMGGGQLQISPEIENFPTWKSVKGPELAAKMKEHTEEYLKVREFEAVEDISRDDGGFVINTAKQEYRARAIIMATGATHRKLGVPGEEEFAGRGVSYCATCDGFFFRGKRVAMVGGGNTAAAEAIYLKGIGCDVVLIHRRETLRAEKRYQDKLKEMGVEILYSHVVEEIVGEQLVKGVRVRDLKSGEEKLLEVLGVFISVGEDPHTALAVKLGVELDENGFIKVDRNMRTSVRYVYAAGDVAGGVRQIVVACGEGAVAATSAYEDIVNPYWVKG
ncbi:MAG TPA: thioredoxin-disulfide reductase [Euryarchaeota archaeon]|nr:MAG: thioredoxin-disulfide reductase [Thermoplasmata archaeon]HDD59965.1 thioredoxin-disulfide reductase [Euryarchaeota archaeon]